MSKRLRYLHAMGVDVWVRRPPRSAENNGDSEPRDQKRTDQQRDTRLPVANSAEDSPRGAWRRMADGLVPGQPTEPDATSPAPDKVRAAPEKTKFGEAPRVHLGLMGNDEICLVFELPETVSSDQSRQRFAQDVALALGHSSVRILDFRWPMVRSEQQDQSAPVLRRALTDQLRGLGKKRLLFGDVALEYVEQSLQAGAVMVPGIEFVMDSADQKRSLWAALRDWRSAGNDAALPGMDTDHQDHRNGR